MGLPEDEATAIRLYTHDYIYQCVNRVLRTQELVKIQPWFAYLKLFHTAVEKASPENSTFCRGETSQWMDAYNIGSIVTMVN